MKRKFKGVLIKNPAANRLNEIARQREVITSLPCKYGHTERYTTDGHCVACKAARNTRKEKVKSREEKLAEANLNHLAWLASYTKTPIEQREARRGRHIDPTSPEGRSIVGELSQRYGLTLASSMATASSTAA